MSKGKNWFEMKAPEMTEDLKNDLTVLQYRRVLDPKRFYKAPDLKVLPKFFQVNVQHEGGLAWNLYMAYLQCRTWTLIPIRYGYPSQIWVQ